MIKFVCNRFLFSIPTLFAVLTIVFLIARVIPGDPAAVILGDSASAGSLAESAAATSGWTSR